MSEKQPSASERNLPSQDSVFADMAARRENLEAQLAEVQARPGFKLDAIEIGRKRQEERRLQRELAEYRDEWSSYDGEDVDKAQAEVDNLSFKSDASEMVHAKLGLRDAKAAFYQNYLDAHQQASTQESDTPESKTTTDGKNDDFIEVTPLDAPARKAIIEDDDAVEVTPIDAPARKAIVEDDDVIEVTPLDAPARKAIIEDDDAVEVTPIDAPARSAVVEQAVSPDLEAKLADLEAARKKWAEISTKRQSRAYDRLNKDGKTVKEQYDMLVQELGRIQLHDQIEAASTETEKNAVVIGYLADEQNKLRELIRHQTDAKFINKFANYMNKGSRKARIAKGVVLGLVVGTGGSLLLGAAGAGAAAGLAVGASRFVRGYTMRHSAGMDQLDDRQLSAARSRANGSAQDTDRVEYTSQIFRDYFETDTRREQAKRRKALYWGVGSVAVGAAAGHFLMHPAIDRIAGWTEHNALGGHLFASGDQDSTPFLGDQEPPHAGGGSGSGDLGHGGNYHGGGHQPDAAPKPQLHDLLNSHDAYNVHPGEGWNETMRDMGIPKDKWAEVLRDAGPKLHEQGWSYFDNTHHEWRISKPGHLSESAVQALKDASARHGFSFR